MIVSQTSLCDEFKLLAEYVFYLLEGDRVINHQTSEETITDLIIRKLKTWKYLNSHSNFSIREFTKPQESKNGADFEWDWYFVDSSGRKWLGLRIQAKVLDLKANKFLSLDYSNKNGRQLNLLVNSSNLDNRIPYYCFYLHKYNENPLIGCSLSNSYNVEELLKINNKPSLDQVIKISFPWHLLVCNNRMLNESLPEKLLLNLNLLSKEEPRFGNLNLLSKEEISRIEKFLERNSDNYSYKEYPYDLSPDRITIIREKN